MRRPRLRAALLTAVLAAGLVLRLWYASEPELFPDEKYALINVTSAMGTGTLLPANSYYPSPVFFAPAAILVTAFDKLEGSLGTAIPPPTNDQGLTPFGVFLCRSLQVVYGTLSLYFVYLLGLTLFSAPAGLIAATAVAFMPLHIRASAYFKPDAQLMLTVLIAFLLSIRALRRDRLGDYAVAGAAIALAMSGKLLGALVALPLVGGILLRRGEIWRRRWARWIVIAVSSAGVFLLLNPYARYYLTWLRGLQNDYQRRVDGATVGVLEIPVRLFQSLLGDTLHGPWIGALALFGLAWIAVSGARDRGRSPKEFERLLFASFPILYVTAFALVTPYFKTNNFLAIVPFTAVAAGFAIERGWAEISSGRPSRASWGVRTLASLILIAVLVTPGLLFTYRSRTPATSEEASLFLQRKLVSRLGRTILVEEASVPRAGWQIRRTRPRNRITSLEVERLSQLGVERVAASDGLLFHESRLDGPDGAFYKDLIQPRPRRIVRYFRPSPFRMRGPSLIAVSQRWARERGDARRALAWPNGDGASTITLPRECQVGEWTTLSIWLPRRVIDANPHWRRAVRIGGRRLHLNWVSMQGGRHLFSSERFRWPSTGGNLTLELASPEGPPRQTSTAVLCWR